MLSFCQNDSPIGEAFWQKDSLITHILFEQWLIMIFSPVANFAQQSIASAEFVLMSADVVLKMIIILSELRITRLCSKRERTLQNILKQCSFVHSTYKGAAVAWAENPIEIPLRARVLMFSF